MNKCRTYQQGNADFALQSCSCAVAVLLKTFWTAAECQLLDEQATDCLYPSIGSSAYSAALLFSTSPLRHPVSIDKHSSSSFAVRSAALHDCCLCQVANKVAELLMEKEGREVCCQSEEDRERYARGEADFGGLNPSL